MKMEPINHQIEKNEVQKSKNKLLLPLIIVFVVVVLAALGTVFYFWKSSSDQDDRLNTSNTTNSQTSNTPTNNDVTTRPTAETVKYTNSAYKFSLSYPKTYQDYGNCEDVKKVREAIDNNQPRPTVSDVAVKVFEVPGENKVYLAPEKTVEINMYQVGQTGVFDFDYSSCKMVNTTLDLIQKWDDKLGDNIVARPTMLEMPFQINFTRANSDADLIDFFDSVSFKPANPLKKSGCVVKRSAYENSAGVFRITIEGGEACYPVGSSPSIYLYSPTTKTALLASFQILPFGLKEDFIQLTK